MINIQTTSFGYKGDANTIKISIFDYNLGFPPKILVNFLNKKTIETSKIETSIDEQTGKTIQTEVPVFTDYFTEMHQVFIPMTQEIYETWGTNDQVVIDFVLEELGLVEI